MTDAAAPASDVLPRATSRHINALNAPLSAKTVFHALMLVRGGAITVTLPEGGRLTFGDDGPLRTEMRIHNYAFARRVIKNGDIGFAEGQIAGDWESDNLSALLTLLADNAERFMALLEGRVLGKLINWMRHRRRANTRAGSKRNILAHYDLGNRFYEAWLDRTMTYSSARFEKAEKDLEAGQIAKYRALAEHLELKAGEHVLEIGCGWGGFAEFAAREYGVRITGLTISDEQLAYATERMKRAGLSDRVTIISRDYRDVEGQFDKVASIEMFEAVGEEYWSAYFGKIAEVLKPGGRAALQIITIKDELFQHYRSRADFIQRYIFPGGMLASVQRLREETAKAGLAWRKLDAFGQSYADTLAEWARRFQSRWEEIRALGFDERFKRLWLFYLGYCEAGFRSGRTNVVQLELSKPVQA
ncbi:MAG: cyclopropane-fatty-acyl-phospholipid synthase family protein [Terricaulis sp.]